MLFLAGIVSGGLRAVGGAHDDGRAVHQSAEKPSYEAPHPVGRLGQS